MIIFLMVMQSRTTHKGTIQYLKVKKKNVYLFSKLTVPFSGIFIKLQSNKMTFAQRYSLQYYIK